MPSRGYLSPVRDQGSRGNADVGTGRRPLRDFSAELMGTGLWQPWPDPLVVETTPSTMAEVQGLAESGAPEGTVVVAEEQTAGRGRHGRTWESAPYAGLWLSLLLRPDESPGRLGWLPLVIGLGVARSLRELGADDAVLKWPNDVLLPGAAGVESMPGKVAGILAERLHDGAVVVGIGINVDHAPEELPEVATSLGQSGYTGSREEVLVRVLAEVSRAYRAWTAGSDLREDYRRWCVTLGRDVTAQGPAGPIAGLATDVDDLGRLIVVGRDGTTTALSAGDVAIVRPPS